MTAYTLVDAHGRPISRPAPSMDVTAGDTASAPALHVAPAKAPGAPRTPAIGAETRLTWALDHNPQRVGTRSHGYNRWMAGAGAFTVQAATDAGVPLHHLRYAVKAGFVTVG